MEKERRKIVIGKSFVLPGSGAVSVEDVKVLAGEKLAAIDARLNGAKSSQDAHLLHVADEWDDVESLEFGVDGVEAADQMFEEELESLWQAEHRLSVDDESSHLLVAVVDEFALVGRRIGAGNGRRAVTVTVRRAVIVVVVVVVMASTTAAAAQSRMPVATTAVMAVK